MASAVGAERDPQRALDAARRIERLAGSDVPEDRFFQEFLECLAETLDSAAGAVWMLDPNGLLGLMSDLRLDAAGLNANPAAQRANVELLLEVLKGGQATLHTPGVEGPVSLSGPRFTGSAQSRGADSPTRHVLLMAPISYRGRAIGVVQLFLDERAAPESRLDDLAFLEETCVSAARYLEWREEAGSAANHLAFWSRFERLIRELHRSLDPSEVAAVAVNDARLLLGCDRLSVTVQEGRRARVLAVSGQERVNHRSNTVRAIRALGSAAVAAGEPITYRGSLEGFPPQIEAPLTEYLRESGARMVQVVPLPAPLLLTAGPAADARRDAPRRAIGAMLVEQVAENRLTPLLSERAELLAEHLAGALHNAQTHDRIFLLPLWRGLGRWTAALRGRGLAQLLAALVLLGGILLALACLPANYRVEGTGRLMPVVQREAFAPWEGEVVELYVTSGERVEPGQPLVRLRNEELTAQLLAARNRLEEKRQLAGALKAEIDEATRRSAREEEIRLRGRASQAQIEIKGLAERIAALERQHDQLTVVAPVGGTVATFQLEQLLMNRPVQRGEVLMEIMDEAGDWRLEIEVPEHRMGHLLAARQAAGDAPLPVEFVLATHPERTFSGTLSVTATRAGVSPERGTVVDVEVAVDAGGLPARRIGAEVQAKIACGEKSLFYVLFGDVVEFAQRLWW